MNYTEHNHHTLKKALGQLPQHPPPESLWRQIESELEREEKEQPLQEALGQLPSYNPPPAVWTAIASGLERKKRPARLRRLGWAAAAASIAAVVAWSLFYLTADPGPQPVYVYETERAAIGLFANNWDSDEAALETAVTLFSKDPIAQSKSQYNRILEEWRELEAAKAEIKEIMELYGRDARLVRQMSEIERERSRLARVMAMAI